MAFSLAPRVPVLLLCTALLGTGCPPKGTQPDDTGPMVTDADGDGYTSDIDCNDGDPSIHPDASELCDGIDNDCDGEIDEDGDTVWYADADDDGYGDAAATQTGCEQPSGFVANADDCDDGDAAIHPDADELCDGIDNDCDGDIDEDGDTVWYADADHDGYGDPDTTRTGCGQPAGFVADGSDCDDDDAAVNPAADELCDGIDNDCDGDIDEDGETPWYRDADGDGYGDAADTVTGCGQPTGYVGNAEDCDDGDAAIRPAADELCDGIDNDCDGDVDEAGALDEPTWYADADGDSYGDAATTTTACQQPSGYVDDATDCNDSEASAYPGADELCDGIDNDCDGDVDEAGALDEPTWYPDVDSDGYGNPSGSAITQCDQPTGYVADNTDCDDMESAAHPGATEVCDDIDNDCDGSVDEYGAVGAPTWYADTDSDGYGDSSRTVTLCDAPTGYVATSGDCDDTAAAVNPAATEVCNGVDDDCDGAIDDADSSVTGQSTWYADADADSYGDVSTGRRACTQPTGYVSDSTDCDDGNAAVNPGAVEVCNTIDDDCDGDIDDADSSVSGRTTWYADRDSDSYGDPTISSVACFQPSGYVADGTDCDDTEPLSNPGETEVCDGIDNDCDGSVDDPSAADADTWYADADSDSYGDAGTSQQACTQPSGYVLDDTDCDDGDTAVNPGVSELCNGADDDCNGLVDDNPDDGSLLAADDDGDGYGAVGTTINQCEGVDNEYDCIDTDPTEPQVVDGATASSTYDGSTAHPWLYIQDGIDAALACVIVAPGLYTENLDFNGKDVTVVSTEGSDLTIVDGSAGSGPVVTFRNGEGADAGLVGFTLTGGSGYEEETTSSYSCGSGDTCTDHYTTFCGGGVYVEASTPTLTQLIIQDNVLSVPTDYTSGNDSYYYFSYGGGMCFRSTSMAVSQVDLYENYAQDGGGAYVEGAAALSFQHGMVYGNTADFGAAFEVDGGSLSLRNVVTAWNEASDTAGGVFASDATITITNAVSGEDDAPTAGSLYLTGTTTGTVMNSVFWGSNTGACVTVGTSATFTGTYNDVYGCAGGTYSGITSPTGTSGNITLYPWFVSITADGDSTNDDWHVQATSPLVNAGDPAAGYNDADGTANDIGAYGGPFSDWE